MLWIAFAKSNSVRLKFRFHYARHEMELVAAGYHAPPGWFKMPQGTKV
jgi:hypothetical protein